MIPFSFRKTLAAAGLGLAALFASMPAQAGDVTVRFGIEQPSHYRYDDDAFVEYRWSDRRHVRPRYSRPSLDGRRYIYDRPARYREVCRLVPVRVWDEYEGDYDIVRRRQCRRVARW
jgi:hypothetical protein